MISLGGNFAFAHGPSTESGETCANILGGGTYRMILRQANELNPEVFLGESVAVPLERLYLQMKEEEWSKPEDGALRSRLMSSRQKHFRIESMTDKDLLQFYANSWRPLYTKVAALWRTETVRISVGPVMNPELEAVLSQILDQYFGTWGMDARSITPAQARQVFSERPWMRLPWLSIAAFISEFKERFPGKYPGLNFSRFWDERSAHYGLRFEQYDRLLAALGKGEKPALCCLSEPGCIHCPLNRRWLKKK